MSEITYCPDCGNDVAFHRIGCCFETAQPLRDIIKQLEAANNNWKDRADALEQEIVTLEAQLSAKDKQTKQLQAALEIYGEHAVVCMKDTRGYCEVPPREVGCTCGFEQALKQ